SRLILFGFLARNRRVEAIFQALAELPERKQFRLHVYGTLWDAKVVHRAIEKLGLEELVKLHGYVTDATLDAALAAAHMAINLRFPTMGEASASQLRIWNFALPSLVTP